MKPTTALVLPLLLALAGCATTSPRLPLDAELRPGERVELPGHAHLRYVGTFNDSRCPPDVQCIHAGDAEVRLQLERGDTAQDVLLRTSARWPTKADGWQISLLRLAHGAAPVVSLRVEQATP